MLRPKFFLLCLAGYSYKVLVALSNLFALVHIILSDEREKYFNVAFPKEWICHPNWWCFVVSGGGVKDEHCEIAILDFMVSHEDFPSCLCLRINSNKPNQTNPVVSAMPKTECCFVSNVSWSSASKTGSVCYIYLAYHTQKSNVTPETTTDQLIPQKFSHNRFHFVPKSQLQWYLGLVL